MNLADPTWSAITPFEQDHDTTRTSVLNKTYEATAGGPILPDKLWFFGAGRFAKNTTSNSLPATGIKYDTRQRQQARRGEVHRDAVRESDRSRGTSRPIRRPRRSRPSAATRSIPATLVTRNTPNNVFGANWRGVLGSKLFAEAAYSQRHFSFLDAGGSSTIQNDSPIFTLTQNGGGWEYNAPYFDATDPEDRNNRQLTANLSYSLAKAGRHDFKGGWEWYRSQRTGGNSQSATSYVFVSDFVADAAGNPVFDANNRIIPTFVPGDTQVQHWIATRGAELDTDNNSFFLQDHWAATRMLTFDLGMRFEKVKSNSTGGIIGVDTSTVVPRLAAAFDPKGDGRTVFHATYGWYSGRYNDTQVGSNSAVGNPALTVGIYDGPAGQGRDFAPGFDPANYQTVFGSFPTANVSMAPGLSSPVTKEFTVSAGTQLGSKGSTQVTYVMRHTDKFIEDFIDIANGTTDVNQNGIDFGTFTNIQFRNSNAPKRDYQAMVFQADYRPTHNWQVAGNYTLQIKNDGNFTGEFQNQPGVSSEYGNFPVEGLPTILTPRPARRASLRLPALEAARLDDLHDGPPQRRAAVALRPAPGRLGVDLQPGRVQRRPHRHPDQPARRRRVSGCPLVAERVLRRSRIAVLPGRRALRHLGQLRDPPVQDRSPLVEVRRLQPVQQPDGDPVRHDGQSRSE